MHPIQIISKFFETFQNFTTFAFYRVVFHFNHISHFVFIFTKMLFSIFNLREYFFSIFQTDICDKNFFFFEIIIENDQNQRIKKFHFQNVYNFLLF